MALAGDMFQQKHDEIFKGLQNVLGIANDILKLGYNGQRPCSDTEISDADLLQEKLKLKKQV